MSVIHKVALEQAPSQVIDPPNTWRPLKFDNQHGTPTIWYEGDPESGTKARMVWLMFTGEDVPPNSRYIGTAFFGQGDTLVVHCYVR